MKCTLCGAEFLSTNKNKQFCSSKCKSKSNNRTYYEAHKGDPRIKRNYVNHKMKIKNKLLDMYGRQCVCCSENIREFLTLEHKHGNGNIHRKTLGSSLAVWKEASKKYQPDVYEILCMNCNWAKRFNKICPHSLISTSKQINLNGGTNG